MGSGRVQRPLDSRGIGRPDVPARPLLLPVFDDHGDTGRAAGFIVLLHERNIQPNACILCGKGYAAETRKQRNSSRHLTKHVNRLADSNDDKDQNDDCQDDQGQVTIADSACGKIGLGFVGPRRKLRQFLIVQSGDGSLHLLRIDPS